MKKILGLLATGAAGFLGGLYLGSTKPEEVNKFSNDVKTKVKDFSKNCIEKLQGDDEEEPEVPNNEDGDFDKVD